MIINKKAKVSIAVVLSIVVMIAVLVTLYVLQFQFIIDGKHEGGLIKIDNNEDYTSRVESNKYESSKKLIDISDWLPSMEKAELPTTAPDVEEDAKVPDYTDTNNQQEGVSEGDIVKTDGTYIYQLESNGVYIVRAADLMLIKLIAVDNNRGELYIYRNKLIAITQLYIGSRYDVVGTTNLAVYNLDNISEPELLKSVTMEGELATSRLTGDRLLISVNVHDSKALPELMDNVANACVEGNYYMTSNATQNNHTVMYNYSIDSGEENSVILSGLQGDLYVSQSYVYLYNANYFSRTKMNIYGVYDSNYAYNTEIYRINAVSLETEGSVVAEGMIRDRYWLDEYDGYLRVFTESSEWRSPMGANLRIYDTELNEVSSITGIAKGERIYSARFNGNTASLVTFLQIDPLFKIDITDPLEPTVSQGLKEAGVSYYIHYLEDSHYTVGIGRDGTETGLNNNIKISLYDNSGADAVNIKNFYINNADADVLYNPKLFYYDPVLKQFGFSYYVDGNYGYKNYGYALYDYDIDSGNISLATAFKHTEDDAIHPEFTNYQVEIIRLVRIGDYYYTVMSQGMSKFDRGYNKVSSLDF